MFDVHISYYQMAAHLKVPQVPFKLNVPGSFLHAVDFYLYVDMSGKDVTQWKVLKVGQSSSFYNGL